MQFLRDENQKSNAVARAKRGRILLYLMKEATQ